MSEISGLSTGLELRREQMEKIEDFITSRIKSRSSGLLYLTGPPGTGKTMSTNCVLRKLQLNSTTSSIKLLQLNCNKISKVKVILAKICKDFGLGTKINSRSTENQMIEILQNAIVGRRANTHVLVLDEIDQIPASRNCDFFRSIFKFPMLEHSKLILVGISNCTSLALLSCLGDKKSTKFEKIVFKAYTFKQVRQIIECYIQNDPEISSATFEPMAIDLIARKVSKENGDIRQAINSYRSVIEDAIIDTTRGTPKRLKRIVYPSTWSLTPSRRSVKRPTPDTCNTLEEIGNLVLSESILDTPPPSPRPTRATARSVMDSTKKRTKQTYDENDATPFFHQVVLCTLCYIFESSNAGKTIEINKPYIVIKKVAEKLDIVITYSEYNDILKFLTSEGLISMKKTHARTVISLLFSANQIEGRLVRKQQISESLNGIDLVKIFQNKK